MIKKGCLDILQSKCENCTDCVLAKTRKNVVFSDGNPETARNRVNASDKFTTLFKFIAEPITINKQ